MENIKYAGSELFPQAHDPATAKLIRGVLPVQYRLLSPYRTRLYKKLPKGMHRPLRLATNIRALPTDFHANGLRALSAQKQVNPADAEMPAPSQHRSIPGPGIFSTTMPNFPTPFQNSIISFKNSILITPPRLVLRCPSWVKSSWLLASCRLTSPYVNRQTNFPRSSR